jgi:hypothetical protein
LIPVAGVSKNLFKADDAYDIYKAAKKGDALSETTEIATETASQIAKHHSWPKYLGGAAKQDLITLPKDLHQSFHGGLDKILPRQWGTAYYESLTPTAREQILNDLAAYTQAFDVKHGTQIFDALRKTGFPTP